MNDSIYRVSLDIHNTTSQVMLNVKKGDNKRRMLFSLTDGDKPYIISPECTAVFRARKPDGKVLYNDCDISENVIAYDLTSQTSATTGIIECEVTLYGSDGKQITSPRFSILIEDTVYSDSEIESKDELTALNEALTAVSNINIDASKTGSKTTVTITGKDGTKKSVNINDGERGEPGEIGVGILSIGLLSTSGLEKTYRIYLSNGQTYDFTVNDGADGEPGETGVSVTGATVTDSGHLNITLSDGTEIDAGEIPQLVKSVNGKTGDVTLSASDVGAPSDEEFDTVSVLSGLDSLFSTSASAMFDTSGMDINIGLSTQQPIYICLSASSGLSAGASITATPYWGGTSMQTAYAATGMKLNRWYQIGHPMVGSTIALPKINVKTDTGSMMTNSMNVFIRYTEVPGDTIDFTVAADAVACNAFVEEEVTSITTTNTPVAVPDTPSVSKAYIYLRYPGTPTTSQVITATPVYSGAEYSAGVVSNMKLNRWYALGVPADGAALSGVALKVNTGTISTVTAVIRYDGNIDGNGVSY